VHDFSASLPAPRNYFDADHLNRNGVLGWLDQGLAELLARPDDGDQ
jgi:hypothetical protein